MNKILFSILAIIQISKGIYIAKVENLTNHFVTTKKLIIKYNSIKLVWY